MSNNNEGHHARKMRGLGIQAGRMGVRIKTPSDRTYGNYVRDAKSFEFGRKLGDAQRKNHR
jgi:hypothetical protein